MKITWPSCRGGWGTASAALLAALLFSFGAPANAQINNTRHNLGANAPAGNNKVGAADTAEVCVFCHTPHGADTNAPVPLWNKRLGANGVPAGGGAYTSYASLQTPSLDGTIAEVGSVSMACLSCHDGSQAMDNIINAPGSGGFSTDGGGNDGLGYGWTGPTVAAATGRMTNAGDRQSMLGLDLSNDHPIGIQYCGGGLTANGGTGTAPADAAGACKDLDFKLAKTGIINSNTIFWVDTGVTGKQRTDLPLYVRTGANASLGPLVECASCHDPHVSNNQANGGGLPNSGQTFLRISNDSSAVCTACHVK